MAPLPRDVANLARWVARLYDLNAVAAAVALLCFMVMFGNLTDPIGGLMFPMALPSMAIEGSAWGIWMVSPVYLLPVRLLCRRAFAEHRAAAKEARPNVRNGWKADIGLSQFLDR
jgi:hypothetical protein